MIEFFQRFWDIVLVRGIFGTLLGIIALLYWPIFSLGALAVYFSLFVFCDGLLD